MTRIPGIVVGCIDWWLCRDTQLAETICDAKSGIGALTMPWRSDSKPLSNPISLVQDSLLLLVGRRVRDLLNKQV